MAPLIAIQNILFEEVVFEPNCVFVPAVFLAGAFVSQKSAPCYGKLFLCFHRFIVKVSFVIIRNGNVDA